MEKGEKKREDMEEKRKQEEKSDNKKNGKRKWMKGILITLPLANIYNNYAVM